MTKKDRIAYLEARIEELMRRIAELELRTVVYQPPGTWPMIPSSPTLDPNWRPNVVGEALYQAEKRNCQ